MKSILSTVSVAFLLFIGGGSFVLAQNGPPPAVPDYSPESWKEYSFPEDNVRFRFPVKPERKETTVGTSGRTAHLYIRETFMRFELHVISFPADRNLETDKDLLNGIVQGGLDWVREFEPKILEQKDILVDGHPGKFMKVETNQGFIVRWKCFAVKNSFYTAYATSKKGDRHGFNWENDFELPAMTFLDSVRLIKTN